MNQLLQDRNEIRKITVHIGHKPWIEAVPARDGSRVPIGQDQEDRADIQEIANGNELFKLLPVFGHKDHYGPVYDGAMEPIGKGFHGSVDFDPMVVKLCLDIVQQMLGRPLLSGRKEYDDHKILHGMSLRMGPGPSSLGEVLQVERMVIYPAFLITTANIVPESAGADICHGLPVNSASYILFGRRGIVVKGWSCPGTGTFEAS